MYCVSFIFLQLARMERPQMLVVFDFDYTLVDGNTDTWITKLSSKAKTAINDGRNKQMCWTNIMQNVFKTLNQENFSQQDYVNCLKSLQFIEGMKETCEFIFRNNIPCIIISDSNTYFIDHLLKRDGLEHVFCEVFTNPAKWKEGCLHVERYHNHGCGLCPANLCKKEVLLGFISNYTQNQPSFNHIFYVGDGKGDLCPSLSLSEKDYVMARDGYTLHDLLIKQKSNSTVKPTVKPWTSGFQILESLKEVFGDN